MQVHLMGGQSYAATLTRQQPYSTLVTEAQVTPAVTPAAATALYGLVLGSSFLVFLRNSSPVAQQIRWGIAPTFTGPSGFLLLPGDSVAIENLYLVMSVISSAVGGLCDVVVWRT